MSADHRSPVIDVIKALACLTIVAHHMAFYQAIGPATTTLTAVLQDWLSQYGRMAVQVFLVLGGYLAACRLAPQGIAQWMPPPSQNRLRDWLQAVGKTLIRRIDRLAGPYTFALACTVLVASIVRPHFDNPAVPLAPTWYQLAANALMLQDILQFEALSAGLWYVAIDLQLFGLTAVILTAGHLISFKIRGDFRWSATIGQGLLVAGATVSLWFWNRQADIDMWAPYFLGSYGMGLMAAWSVHAKQAVTARRWLGVIVFLGMTALVFDYRGRIAVALCTACFLAVAMRSRRVIQWRIPQQHWLFTPVLKALLRIGTMSYSVFLMHFAVLLLVGTLVDSFTQPGLLSHTMAYVLAFGLTFVIGHWMQRHVEPFPISRWFTTSR